MPPTALFPLAVNSISQSYPIVDVSSAFPIRGKCLRLIALFGNPDIKDAEVLGAVGGLLLYPEPYFCVPHASGKILLLSLLKGGKGQW